MVIEQYNPIELTLEKLFDEAKNDRYKIMKGFAKSVFRGIQPTDFKEAYLSITKEQGKHLTQLVLENRYKNIIEFGTSFGISTLFLAQGVLETKGQIITTEIIDSKANQAKENFKQAGVHDLIEVRIGNAMETLKNHNTTIDLLVLDGWKDLYLPLFEMLEPNFRKNTTIYVDNVEMTETQSFLTTISQNNKYQIEHQFAGKVALITLKKY